MRKYSFITTAILVGCLSAGASVDPVSLPKGKSLSSAIQHIIVLMMENRSFDHLLGWLKEDSSLKIEGLKSGMTCPRDLTDETKGSVPITRGGYDVSPDDPMHDYNHIYTQINKGAMNGFVYDAIRAKHNETNPVSMFDKHSAPIINTLAQEYAVFDQWFCSIPGPTDPNRAFAMAGTSLGVLSNFNGTLWDQQSYFDYLRVNGHTFGGYYQDDPWALLYFQDTNKPPNSQYMKDLDSNFYKDLEEGNIAEFVWLQPRMTTWGEDKVPSWQHPDASVLEGERLIKDVYEAIRASSIWNSTLFLITYDEHGGFYDHVTPPSNVPAPDSNVNANGFAFDRLGVRIPTIAISPYIKKGTIVNPETLPDPSADLPTESSAFDATSVLATANKILGIEAPALGNRMSWAATFTSILNTDEAPRTDCLESLPELPSLHTVLSQTNAYEIQRSKPLNHHLEAQLLFYCLQNNDSKKDQSNCLEYVNANCKNQGTASDWIIDQVAIYTAKLRAAESMHRTAIDK